MAGRTCAQIVEQTNVVFRKDDNGVASSKMQISVLQFRQERKAERRRNVQAFGASGNKYEGILLEILRVLSVSDDKSYTLVNCQKQTKRYGCNCLPDGSTYEGSWMNDLPHGFGINMKDGAQYVGSFKVHVYRSNDCSRARSLTTCLMGIKKF